LQQTDYYDAFNFATTLPDVDPEKMVYWGTSFSGGNVIYAAAVDKRIKAAIVQCPAVSGETRSLAFQDRIPSLFADRARIVAGEKSHQTRKQPKQEQHRFCFLTCTRIDPSKASTTVVDFGKTG
jgi:dienelactone hydrolase